MLPRNRKAIVPWVRPYLPGRITALDVFPSDVTRVPVSRPQRHVHYGPPLCRLHPGTRRTASRWPRRRPRRTRRLLAGIVRPALAPVKRGVARAPARANPPPAGGGVRRPGRTGGNPRQPAPKPAAGAFPRTAPTRSQVAAAWPGAGAPPLPARLRERALPRWWTLCPTARPAHPGARLERLGLRPWAQPAGMAVDLERARSMAGTAGT
jgi:hypothetical protein